VRGKQYRLPLTAYRFLLLAQHFALRFCAARSCIGLFPKQLRNRHGSCE